MSSADPRPGRPNCKDSGNPPIPSGSLGRTTPEFYKSATQALSESLPNHGKRGHRVGRAWGKISVLPSAFLSSGHSKRRKNPTPASSRHKPSGSIAKAPLCSLAWRRKCGFHRLGPRSYILQPTRLLRQSSFKPRRRLLVHGRRWAHCDAQKCYTNGDGGADPAD